MSYWTKHQKEALDELEKRIRDAESRPGWDEYAELRKKYERVVKASYSPFTDPTNFMDLKRLVLAEKVNREQLTERVQALESTILYNNPSAMVEDLLERFRGLAGDIRQLQTEVSGLVDRDEDEDGLD